MPKGFVIFFVEEESVSLEEDVSVVEVPPEEVDSSSVSEVCFSFVVTVVVVVFFTTFPFLVSVTTVV